VRVSYSVVRRLLIAIATSAVAACGSGAPAPPLVNPPPATQTVNGSERIGWDQPSADAVDLVTIRYAIYVDGTRTEAAGVECAPSAGAAGFACTARLPAMTPGLHTLQLASFVNDGGVLESPRSAALQVTVTASSAATADARAPAAVPLRKDIAANAARSRPADALAADLAVDGLDDPIDLAFAADGRLFVAERTGSIRIVRDGRLVAEPALSPGSVASERGQLLAIAIDPDVGRTHFVFIVFAARDAAGRMAFTLARFRESDDTLGDAAVLLDRIPAGTPPRASLRFGADAKLYAAFDDGGDPRRAGDPASLNGKLLRLNADGTTPRDQASPAIADGLIAPAGFDWSGSAAIWIVEAAAGVPSQLRTLDPNRRYALPGGEAPSAILFAHGDPSSRIGGGLLIASADSSELLRVRFDPGTAAPVAAERLAVDVDCGIQALAVAPDASVYAATPTRIVRLRTRN